MRTLRLGFTTDDDRSYSPEFHLRFRIETSSLAEKWAAALSDCLKSRLFFEKNYSLMGVSESGRSLLQIELELNQHLGFLNLHPELNAQIQHLNLPLPSPLSQNELNQAHHLFEVLIGQVWAPSEVYQRVNSEMRHSIRQLNHLVHEYEALSKALRQRDELRIPTATLIVSFLEAPRALLENRDYAEVVFDRACGDVFLHYAQLGKSHMEAFLDHDDQIFDDNISGLRYLTGEFDIHLGADFTPEKALLQKQNLEHWLQQKGIDARDPKLSLGRIRVARLAPEISASPSEIQNKLRQYPNLVEITLESDGVGRNSCSYPYSRAQSEKFAKNYFADSRLKKAWNRFNLGIRMLEI